MILEQHRAARLRLLAVGDRGKRLDIQIDMLQRVFGNAGRIGQHDGNRLADVANLAVGQHRLMERLELRQRLQPQRNPRNDVAEVGAQQGHGEPRQRRARAAVDRLDQAVRHGAAQDHRMELARSVDVGDIGSPATQETQILDCAPSAGRYRNLRPSSACSLCPHTICEHREPPRRSEHNRCSGRGCPTARHGSAPRRHRARWSASACAVVMKPGVQKPHCSA